ncbi:hypothetical protein [Marinicella gelatinilytica]|uniref:hypothetical protein n=1 Tax=Marinicella gelatinilytica TaxID=2996017 RepID=UPI002260DA32|nr:hypothetical protein [Marinicella gelatinilytica]MCX7545186.1 hypothetical protein [Marinicella gelatinilytica]
MNRLTKLLLSIVALVAFQQVGAIRLSDNDQGQALIFPYYSVQNDLRSTITIQNNSNQYKAISVEFREGFNGQPVLPFNIYLSPLESWSGQLVSATSTFGPPYSGQATTHLLNFNQGCAPWLSNPQKFYPYEIDNDPAINNLVRTQTGFIQVYEMGEVTGDHASAIDNDCGFIDASWNAGGQWSLNPNIDIQPATGGLSGSLVIKNMVTNDDLNYQAIAINNFHDSGDFLHGSSGNMLLMDANTLRNQLEINSQAQEHNWQAAYKAASAPFVRTLLSDQFIKDAGTDTEVVLTFPTKNKYVNYYQPNRAPFTQEFQSQGACELVSVSTYDNNGVLEPQVNPQVASLCRSVNVLGFNHANYSTMSYLLDQYHGLINIQSELGTVEFDFSRFATADAFDTANSNERYVYYGLPVIGVVMHKVEAGGNTSLTMQEMTPSQRIVTDLIFGNGF